MYTRALNDVFFFFFNDTATTEIYTLSLHDALPILLEAAGVIDKKTRNNPKKGEPHAKTKERILEKADKIGRAHV